MNDRLEALEPYPMVELDRRREAAAARGLDVLDFGTGDPREPTPGVVREALLAAVPAVSQYPTVAGPRAVRDAMAGYCRRRFGVELDPDSEILPTGGSKEAIFHLPMTVLDPSSLRRAVVYGEPAYPVFEIGALFAEAETVPIALDEQNGYLLVPEMVRDGVLERTAVVFLNYPHNPTGRTMPDDAFRAWIAARERFGFLLVSDECYADLYFGELATATPMPAPPAAPRPPRSVLEFGRAGCLAVHSLSKRSGMTGYRSGFVAGDADVVARYRRFRSGMGVASPVWTQAAARAAWSCDAHPAERRAVFGRKREILLGALAARGLRVFPSDAGLFLWVAAPDGETGDAYAARLDEVGIVVAPGSYFGDGQERFFRIALVPSVAECERAAAIWPR